MLHPLLMRLIIVFEKVEFAFMRTELVHMMNTEEKCHYDELVTSINKDIDNTQSLIETLRDEFSEAQLVQQHRQEYDAMAGVIQKTPGRQESITKIKQLEDQLEGLRTKQARLVERLSLHRKQGYLLSFALHQLIDIIDHTDDDLTSPMEVA